MSDDRATNIARMPPQQKAPDKFEIDFPALMMMSVEKGLDPQVIVTMFQGEIERRQREALDMVKADIYADMLPVLKDGVNKHLGNRYTTVPAMMAMLQPILKTYGVFVGFDVGVLPGEPAVADGFIRVRIVVSYRGYTDRASYIDEPIARGGTRGGVTQMNEQQAITSATTYGARTLLKLKFNVLASDDDDDAEGAGRETEGQTQHTGSRQSGNAGPSVDHDQYKAAFRRRLHLAANNAEVDALLDIPDIAKWLANAPGQIKVDTDIMVATKRKLLADAAAKTAQNGSEQTAANGERTEQPTGPSEQAKALLARIASCQTTVALDSLTTAPEFTGEVAKLSWIEGDLVTEALKAKGVALAGAPGADA